MVRTPIRRPSAGRTALSQEGLVAQERAAVVPRDPPRTQGGAPAASRLAHRAFTASVILLDLFVIGAAFAFSALVRFEPARLVGAALQPSGIAVLVGGAMVWVAVLSSRDAYAPRVMVSVGGQFLAVVGAALFGWVLTHLLAFLVKARIPFESRLVAGISLAIVPAALAFARLAIVRPVAARVYRRLARGPLLVLGNTERAERLAEAMESRDARRRRVDLRPVAELTPQAAARLVAERGYGEVVIEPEGRGLGDALDIAFACLDARAEVSIVSSQFQVVIGRAAIGEQEGIPVIRFRRPDFAGPEVAIKRLIDLVGACAGLVFLAPLLAGIAIGIKLTSSGPVLFRQERVGRKGRRFLMLKFRTMVNGNSSRTHQRYLRAFIQDGEAAATREDGTKIYKLTQDPRVTRVGAWLRALSLDELPQFWNVLKGEMSLVGPRPCLPYEWELYRPWQRRRLDVLPGCTGLWQVTGRSLVSFEEMVILDLHYAHHGTIGRDLGLILQTVPAMVRGRGGY